MTTYFSFSLPVALHINNQLLSTSHSSLQINQILDKGCDERCTCAEGGHWLCLPRCSGVFFKRGKTVLDPNCHAKPAKGDDCCSVMVCAENAQPEVIEPSQRLIESGNKNVLISKFKTNLFHLFRRNKWSICSQRIARSVSPREPRVCRKRDSEPIGLRDAMCLSRERPDQVQSSVPTVDGQSHKIRTAVC